MILFGSYSAQNNGPEEGTYQLIISNTSKKEMVFTSEFISNLKIDEIRKEDEDITIVVNGNVSVYIPSKNKISSQGFKKLEFARYE